MTSVRKISAWTHLQSKIYNCICISCFKIYTQKTIRTRENSYLAFSLPQFRDKSISFSAHEQSNFSSLKDIACISLGKFVNNYWNVDCAKFVCITRHRFSRSGRKFDRKYAKTEFEIIFFIREISLCFTAKPASFLSCFDSANDIATIHTSAWVNSILRYTYSQKYAFAFDYTLSPGSSTRHEVIRW